jgi:AhpD family alkylhydroperoxidase
MERTYPEYHQHLRKLSGKLTKEIRGAMSGFGQLYAATTADGVLSAKVKQLMALSIAVTVRCDGCIAYHVYDALRAGATRQEIMESIAVAVMMGGGPAMVYGCEALEALEQFETSGVPRE